MMSVAFRQTMSRRSVAGLAAAIAASSLFVGPNQANAQTYTWGGAGSTTTTSDYNLGTNWSTPPAGAPPVAAGQSAVFDNSGSTAVSVSTGSITVDSWTFNAGAQIYTFSGGAVNFNTGLVDNAANDVIIRNNIGGTGTVTNAGTGTLTLTGVLSYTGLTSATGGSIILGDATNAATLPGDATLAGGNLAVANGSLGSGTIAVFGGSAIVVGLTPGLSATAGTATINNGGTVTLQNSATAGSAQINNTGLVDFADTATAANATIVTTGTGLLQFRNSATAGNATISMGNGTSLTFGGNASGGTARLVIDAGGQLDISLTSAGIGTGSIAGAGDIFLGAKNLTVGGNNLSTPFSGVLQDGGTGGGTGGSLTKVGSGTLTLSGANTYTGATIINAGTLSVNGSIANSSGVTVNSGGILGGTGTVAATTINSGGALAPGNGSGTLAVSGNLRFNTGASYNINVSPAGASKTSVSGTATLAGTVNATYQPGSYIARRYTILSAADTVTGTFAALNNAALPGNVGAALSYDLYNVYLNLTLKFDPSGGLNTNQQNVANALQDYFNRTGGIPGPFAALNANGLSQASGQAGTGPQQSGLAATGQFINAVFDNGFVDAGPSNTGFGNSGDPNTGFGNSGDPNTGFGNGGDPNTGFGNEGNPNTGFGNGGDPNTGFGNQGRPNTGFGRSNYAATPRLSREAQQAYAALTPRVRASSFEARWRLWGAVYGGNATVNGDGATGSNTTTSRVYGLASGATYRLSPATQLGFALGGAGSSFAIADGFGSGKADMFTAAVYARHAVGPAYVAAALGYTWQDASTDRTVTIAGSDALHASFHPQALTARLEGGRRYTWHAFGITPYAALQATSFFMPGYGEAATSGSSQFALSYASRTATATRAELGARWDKAVAVRGGVLTFKARTAWAHDWNTDRAATATFQTLPGATFTVYGAAPTADAALLSVGAQMAWARGWAVAANFDGEFSANSRSYAGKGSVRYAW